MRTGWWIATALVLLVCIGGSTLLARRRSISAAQAVAIAFLAYAMVFASLWGMASHFIRYPEVDVPRPVKLIMLSIAGGLLAQLLTILNGYVRSTLPKKRVAALYVRGAIGALAGVVGVLISAVPYSDLEKVPDSLAVLSGVIGGALGVAVLDVARNKVFGSDKK
ncbi:MAG: hypothetical protein QOJ64_3256 [Acidobacteriota bacterium]|jgi:hypothetical protein|nr:hypothetical protein [Acidobacteriota bacterium]